MSAVLCYGDSLTWGYDPAGEGRLPRERRWTGVLQATLGPDVEVVAEGLVNRTTNLDDPVCPERNGLRQLSVCLDSHKPLDVVVVMLGTNDLKARFARSATDVAESAARLAGAARASACGRGLSQPRVLLVCPPPVREVGIYREMYSGAETKAAVLPELYRRYAEWVGVEVFDAGAVVSVSEADGVHIDADANRRLGLALSEPVRALLAVR